MTGATGNEMHEFALALTRLQEEMKALIRTIESNQTTTKTTANDHESRLRTIEAQPRGVTWREFLAVSTSMILGAGGLLALVDRI